MQNEAKRKKCVVRTINGIEDHVHLVVEIHPDVSISQTVKQIKGTSSLFVNDSLHPAVHFKWQGGYSASSVSRWDLPRIIGYVKKQKGHPERGTTKPQLECGWDDEKEN